MSRASTAPKSEPRLKVGDHVAVPPGSVILKFEDAQEFASWLAEDGARIADLLVAVEGLVDEANAYAGLYREQETGEKTPIGRRFDVAEEMRNDAIDALVHLRQNSTVIRDALYKALSEARRAPEVES